MNTIKSVFKFCFKSSLDDREYTDEIFVDVLVKNGSFCSHLIFFVLMFAIGNIANKNDGLVKDSEGIKQPYTKALNVTPDGCWPKNILSLPKKYPKFWEKINM